MKDLLELAGLEFHQLVILIVLAVLGTVVIKFTISFDLNEYLEGRRKANLNKLRNACTHHRVVKRGSEYSLQSLFVSPPGTLQWQCQQCLATRYFTDGEQEQMTQHYLDNFDKFTKDQKKFQRLLKKNKMV